MKRHEFNRVLFVIVVLVMGWLMQAGALAEPPVGAMTYPSASGDHPVGSTVAHIICLSLIVGAGASIISALFKSPYRQ